MELEPTRATFSQVMAARNGEFVAVDEDVQDIVNRINEIDPHLRVRYSEAGEYFVVYWLPENDELGNGYLVTTAQELDARLVTLVQRIYHETQQPGYSLSAAMDAHDAKIDAEKDRRFTEENGEMYERLAHAMRKELGYDKGRVFVGKDTD